MVIVDADHVWIQGSPDYEHLLAALDIADVAVGRKLGLPEYKELRDRVKVQPHTIVADADLDALIRAAHAAVALVAVANLENTVGWEGVELVTALTPLTAKGGVLERFAMDREELNE